MAFTPKPNTGALFKNDRKDSDEHPDYRGDLDVDGVAHWINAWLKEGKRGKFLSLSIIPKAEKVKRDNAGLDL